MFEKQLMINGIRKQQNLLGNLAGRLELTTRLEDSDCRTYEIILKQVEQNLKKLRKIRKNCLECHEVN